MPKTTVKITLEIEDEDLSQTYVVLSQVLADIAAKANVTDVDFPKGLASSGHTGTCRCTTIAPQRGCTNSQQHTERYGMTARYTANRGGQYLAEMNNSYEQMGK